MQQPDLTVSIVTHNSKECLQSLLPSLCAQNGVRWELHVVDNASTDGTADLLRQNSVGQVTFNAENVGYGRAHNQNRGQFRGRHVLFLNPDVVLSPGLFATLVHSLDDAPEVAITGPMVLDGPQRTPFRPRRFYPGEAMIPLEPGLCRDDPAWITGSCLAVRRSVFEAVGGFDPDYFLYAEDPDLCLRIRRAGYRIGWLPQLSVLHSGQHSQAGLTEYQRDCNLFCGLTVFWQKHYEPHDVRAMLRFQCLAASLMLLGGKLLPVREAFRPDRLRARRDVCRDWLRRHHVSLLPVDFRSWRIVARMLQLSLASLQSGTLDLEDL